MNPLLLAFLAVFLLRSGIQVFLNRLNISYLRQHGAIIPELFQDSVDREKLGKISAYAVDSENFSLLANLAGHALSLAILFSGLLPDLVKMNRQLGKGPILEGLVFFAVLAILAGLLRIPFSLYENFVIEERYGFNTRTLRVWITDLFKSIAISAVLGGVLLLGLLALVVHGGNAWWIWAWILAGGVEFLMLWLFPLVIAPLFNKFEPIEDRILENRIKDLMERVGLRVKGVFRMDASKRSRHTNAYFTGIGRSKRIVLFDTLLTSHSEGEVLAVLAHEVGHWEKKHVAKELIFMESLSLVFLFAVAELLRWPLVYQTFGFQEPILYVGILLTGALLSPLGYFLQPLFSSISRKFEREADDFCVKLMHTAEPMGSALKRLAADNLANLTPHPLYSWFYYSHPPLVERISRLRRIQEKENG